MALWNERNLIPPMVMNAPRKSKLIKDQICKLATTSSSMLDYYSSLETFERAAAYLSRFCNRWKHRLRNMHGFQIMRRINQTLIRIKSLDLMRDLMDFHSFLPESSYIEKEVNLPVRSNLEYLLVRLQGLSKLLLRVVHLTKQAARYHLNQIARNFLYHIFSTFLGLMAELWLFARSVCRRTDQFYNELFTVLPILPDTKVNWLPEGYQLPEHLGAWLGEEFDREIMFCSQEDDVLKVNSDMNIYTLLQHRGKDEETKLLAKLEAAAENGSKAESAPAVSSVPKTMLMQSLRSDVGELVTSTNDRAKANVKQPKKYFDPEKLNHLRSKFHVQQFISQERAKRTGNLNEALTGGISEQHFGDFNVRLMKEFKKLSSGDFVKFFKEQFIALLQRGS